MTKIILELKGKQVDRLIELALEHNLTLGSMLHAIIGEYLGEATEKPIRKVKPAGVQNIVGRKTKQRPRRRDWSDDENEV